MGVGAQRANEWIPLIQSLIVGFFAVGAAFAAQWWTMRRDLRNRALDAFEKRQQKWTDRQVEYLVKLQGASENLSNSVYTYFDTLVQNETLQDYTATIIRFSAALHLVEDRKVFSHGLELLKTFMDRPKFHPDIDSEKFVKDTEPYSNLLMKSIVIFHKLIREAILRLK